MCRHVIRVRAHVASEQRREPRAFTLVELFIVIGVIALLIALLFPAFNAARRAAMRTACQSNMRQVVNAFIMYVNDNNGCFPRPAQEMYPRAEDWIYFQANRRFADGRVTRYLGNGELTRQVLICPGDEVDSHSFFFWGRPVPEPGADWPPNQPRPQKYRFSYTVSEFICRIPPQRTLKINQIRRPSDKIFLVDESSETIDDGCWAWANDQGAGGNVMSARHNRVNEMSRNTTGYGAGKGNVAYCDGHVAYVDRKDTFDIRYFDPRR